MSQVCALPLLLSALAAAFVLLSVAGPIAWPEEKFAASDKKTSLADLAWIAGCWQGQFFKQGPMEETWQAPIANCMVGTFRAVKNGKAFLYEILLIEETAEGILFHMRHFDPGLVAWASEADGPATYSLRSCTGHKAVFENLERPFPQRMVYERKADDELEIRVEGNQQGKLRSIVFRFKAAK